MNENELKRQLGERALSYIQPNTVLGVGSGTTVNCFIDALKDVKNKIEGAVAASKESEQRLKKIGIEIVDLNSVNELGVYVDGADELNQHKQLIKGGGAALTREKIIAAVSKKFICMATVNKKVDVLGKFPLPIEVIPMARSYVARQLVKMGGDPHYRQGVITDNGNVILDVYHLEILDPVQLEKTLNDIPGVVTNGLFAIRPADEVLLASQDGIINF